MASTYNYLGIEKMATGENAGTWGTKTNTNLDIIQQAASGYHSQSVNLGGAGANTTALLITDGDSSSTADSLTNAARNTVIKLTGAITGNKIVTFPTDTEGLKVVFNATTGGYTVQVKGASDSGSGTTFATDDKGKKMVYMSGTDLVEVNISGDVTASSTTTFTNKTLTAAKIVDGGYLADANGNEGLAFGTTASAVNELKVTNAATTNGPILSATGETNVPINITPKGTGDVFINPPSSGSLAIKGNATNGGKLKIFEDTDLGSYHTGFTTGNLTEDIVYTLPLEDATTSGDALTSNASGVLSWTTISGGPAWQAVITADPSTATVGYGYFCDTSSAAFTVTLPASATRGDQINFIDYGGTFDSNNLTIGRNSHKIQGSAADLTVAVERAGFALVYVDATQGWLLLNK